MGRQQQLQLTAGVAAAFETQQQQQGGGCGSSCSPARSGSAAAGASEPLPAYSGRRSLAERMAQIGVAGPDGSPLPGYCALPAPALDGTLAPLQHLAAHATAGGGGLSTVPEVAESHTLRSGPATSGLSGSAAASSAASTPAPSGCWAVGGASPLTPASAYVAGAGTAEGGSPLPATGLTRFATPATSLAQLDVLLSLTGRSPGGMVAAAASPGGGAMGTPPSAARTPAPGLGLLLDGAGGAGLGASLGSGAAAVALSDAPTPPTRLGSAPGSAGSVPGSVGSLGGHYSEAGTPGAPDFAASPLFGAGPSVSELAETATPDHAALGLAGSYAMRRLGSGGGGQGLVSAAAPGTRYVTPLSGNKTPLAGMPELQAS